MTKKPPDPSPPPKRTPEDNAFRSLLKKLVAVPREEVQKMEAERMRRRRRKRKRGS